MTLPKHIKRGDGVQKEQQKDWARMTPQSVKHTDLLTDREEVGSTPLEMTNAPRETNPQDRTKGIPEHLTEDGCKC